MKFSNYLIILLIIFPKYYSKGQNKEVDIECSQLSKLLNKEGIPDFFEFKSINNDELVLYDMSNKFSKCDFFYWAKFKTRIITRTVKNPDITYKHNPNYFYISNFEKVRNIYHLLIVRPISGLYIEFKFKLNKGNIQIFHFSRGAT